MNLIVGELKAKSALHKLPSSLLYFLLFVYDGDVKEDDLTEIKPFFVVFAGADLHDWFQIGSSYLIGGLTSNLLLPQTLKIPVNIFVPGKSTVKPYSISNDIVSSLNLGGIVFSQESSLASSLGNNTNTLSLISYEGVVSHVFDDTFGLYELDDGLLLCLAYYPRTKRSGQKVFLNVGETIILHNCHCISDIPYPDFMKSAWKKRKRGENDSDGFEDENDDKQLIEILDEFACLVPCAYSYVKFPQTFVESNDVKTDRDDGLETLPTEWISKVDIKKLLEIFSSYDKVRDTLSWIEGLEENNKLSLLERIFNVPTHSLPSRNIYREFFHHHLTSCCYHDVDDAELYKNIRTPSFETIAMLRQTCISQFLRQYKFKRGSFNESDKDSLVIKSKIISRFLMENSSYFDVFPSRVELRSGSSALFGILKLTNSGTYYLQDHSGRVAVVFKDTGAVARVSHSLLNVLCLVRSYFICIEYVPKSRGEIYPYVMVDLSEGDRAIQFLAQMKANHQRDAKPLVGCKFTNDIKNRIPHLEDSLLFKAMTIDISNVLVRKVVFSDYSDSAVENYLFSVVVEAICIFNGAKIEFSVLTMKNAQWLREGMFVNLKNISPIVAMKRGSAVGHFNEIQTADHIFAEFTEKSEAIPIKTQLPIKNTQVKENLSSFLSDIVHVRSLLSRKIKDIEGFVKQIPIDNSDSKNFGVGSGHPFFQKGARYYSVSRLVGRFQSKSLKYLAPLTRKEDSEETSNETDSVPLVSMVDEEYADQQLWIQLVLEDVCQKDYTLVVFVKLQGSFPLGLLKLNDDHGGPTLILRDVLVRHRKKGFRDCYFSLSSSNIDIISSTSSSPSSSSSLASRVDPSSSQFELNYYGKMWRQIVDQETVDQIRIAHINRLNESFGSTLSNSVESVTFIDSLLFRQTDDASSSLIFRIVGRIERIFMIEFQGDGAGGIFISEMEISASDGTGEMRINLKSQVANKFGLQVLLHDLPSVALTEQITRYCGKIVKSVGSLRSEPNFRCSYDPPPPISYLSGILDKAPTTGNFFNLINYLVCKCLFQANLFDFVGRVRTSGSCSTVFPNKRTVKMTVPSGNAVASKSFETAILTRKIYMDLIRMEPTNPESLVKSLLKDHHEI